MANAISQTMTPVDARMFFDTETPPEREQLAVLIGGMLYVHKPTDATTEQTLELMAAVLALIVNDTVRIVYGQDIDFYFGANA